VTSSPRSPAGTPDPARADPATTRRPCPAIPGTRMRPATTWARFPRWCRSRPHRGLNRGGTRGPRRRWGV